MNFDVGEQSRLSLWRRFGVRCARAFFRPPATMPAADVLYCDHFSGLPSSNYGNYVKCHERTLEIDLLQPEEQLLKQMSQSARAKIRRAETREAFELKAYSPEDLSRSSDILMQFADFYDVFARSKALPPLCRDDLLTLSRAELLWLTCVQKDGETLVWRCYVADHGRARMRFACSHFRQLAPDLRNLIGVAHCWLTWQNMRMFRANGFTIYDFGGWYEGTEDEARLNINRFKELFGGVQASLCSLETPLTLRGRIYLRVRRAYNRFAARPARDAGAGEGAADDQAKTFNARPPKRVAFVIHELSLGGAERVMTIMANYWAAQGRSVTIITIGAKTAPVYILDDSVMRISLDLYGASRSPISGVVNNVRRLIALRRAIARTRPDVVISFMVTVNILTLLATRLLGIPVIVAEHTVPGLSPRGRVWGMLRRATYPLADRLVVLTRDAGDFFWPSLQRRIRVIPNPVRALGGEPSGVGAAAREPVIVTVGRLEAVKQIDHILRAFAGIAGRFPEWRLAIVGDGSLRHNLKKLGDDLGVGNRVEWAGFAANPEDYLCRAGLFVMASHHEGFPCALQEAMACGLPVLSYDCPGGIREILRDGRDGVLVPPGDIGQLGKAMASLIENPDRRAKQGEAALAVRERYSIDRIMQIWDDELQKLGRQRLVTEPGAKYLIRFDDICPTMNWEVWREIEKILVEHEVKPILAVVPDNRDPKLRVDEPHPHFWEEVRKWQSWGWTIGLHGYQHAYVTTNAGYVGINRYSEFAGLPASEQREKLRRGIAIFRKEGVTPDLWIAPAHSFDTHTLEALQAEGVDVVSDGFFPAPGRDGRGIFWAPQQMWWFANRRRGVWTVCLHHNEWTQARLDEFRDEVKRRRERLTSVEEMLDVYGGRKLSVMDKAFAKGYLLLLLARHQIKKLISFASSLLSQSMRAPKRTISSK